MYFPHFVVPKVTNVTLVIGCGHFIKTINDAISRLPICISTDF